MTFNIENSLHTDYSNKYMQIATKEQCKIKLISKADLTQTSQQEYKNCN